MYMGVRALIGGVNVFFENKDLTADKIWAELIKHEKTHNIITAKVDGAGNHHVKTASGLATSHAYTVLGTKLLTDGTKLVKIRNPWGKETYKGRFSDKSADWTAARIKEVGLVKKDDGVFYMPVADFKRDFS